MIVSRSNSTQKGDRVEAKVADFIKNDLGIELTDFGNKVRDRTGQVIGDIDCATQDVLIEVKSSIGSVKTGQFPKYMDKDEAQFINVSYKRAILYVDEPMLRLNSMNTQKLIELKEMGVEVVNSLDGLREVLR